jgi:hypothetical protein
MNQTKWKTKWKKKQFALNCIELVERGFSLIFLDEFGILLNLAILKGWPIKWKPLFLSTALSKSHYFLVVCCKTTEIIGFTIVSGGFNSRSQSHFVNSVCDKLEQSYRVDLRTVVLVEDNLRVHKANSFFTRQTHTFIPFSRPRILPTQTP